MYVQIILSPGIVLLGLALTGLCAWLGVWLTTYRLGNQNLAALLSE